MATPTYDLIASNVLTSSAASVTFSSIPATYRDLVLVGRGTFNDQAIPVFTFGSGFSGTRLFGNGSSLVSDQMPNTSFLWTPVPTSRSQFSFTLEIFDYSDTTKNKAALCQAGNDAGTGLASFRSATNSAITSITIMQNSIWNFQPNSSFHLYGIAG